MVVVAALAVCLVTQPIHGQVTEKNRNRTTIRTQTNAERQA
jgi:hypothetical protein